MVAIPAEATAAAFFDLRPAWYRITKLGLPGIENGRLNPIEQYLVGGRKLKTLLDGRGLDQNLGYPVSLTPGSQSCTKGLGNIAIEYGPVSAFILNSHDTGASPVQRIRLAKHLERSIEEGFGVVAFVDPDQFALDAQLINKADTVLTPEDDQYSGNRDNNEQLMNHGFYLAVQTEEQVCPRFASATGQSRARVC